MIETGSSALDKVLALAYQTAEGWLLWLANLTPEPQKVSLSGLPAGEARIGRLDKDNFVAAVTEPAAFAADSGAEGDAAALELVAFAVYHIELAA